MPLSKLVRFFWISLLLSCGLGLRGVGREAWVEVRSPHFVAYSDAGEAEARKALVGFEGIRSVFDRVIPGIRVDPPKPMILLVVKDEEAMRRFLPSRFEGRDPSRPAGVFLSGEDRDYAILRLDVDHQADQPYFVLFHEYTHSIVHQNFPALPTWLDEGIADFYGATQIRAGQVLIGRVPGGRLQRLRTSVRLPMETLLTVTHDSPHYREGEKTGIFYAQSWAFVHYLFLSEPAQKAGLFRSFLKASQEEADALKAARSAFGDLARLSTTLGAYANQPVFRYLNLPLTVQLGDADFLSRPLEEAQALVVRAEFLQHTRQEEASRPLLAQALERAPRAPDVQAALGQGHLLRGEAEGARLAFEAALQLGSQDFRVPYQLARLAQERRGAGVASAQVLEWLERARALRPDFAAIHMALCRQYSLDPKDATRALSEGRQAIELEPNQLSHRIQLGIACLNLDLEAEARALGEQVRRLAATPWERRGAETFEAQLRRYLEQKAARTGVEPPPAPGPGGPAPRSVAPIKFSLPNYLAPLGQQVMALVAQDKVGEAVQLVEAALAKAKYEYDRKALRTLLAALRQRVAAGRGPQLP